MCIRDRELNNTPIPSNKEYLNFVKSNSIKCCYGCFSQACLAKIQAAKTLGLEYRGRRDCKRKEKNGWTFGNLEELKAWEPQKKSKMNTATVSIQPEPFPPTPNTIVDNLDVFNAQDSDERFIEIPSQMVRATTRPRFTARTTPKFDEIFSDMSAEDKECAICGDNEMTVLYV